MEAAIKMKVFQRLPLCFVLLLATVLSSVPRCLASQLSTSEVEAARQHLAEKIHASPADSEISSLHIKFHLFRGAILVPVVREQILEMVKPLLDGDLENGLATLLSRYNKSQGVDANGKSNHN